MKLPKPQLDLDFPLMKALEVRRTKRRWKDEALLPQDISNLLWAACGITKEASSKTKSKRTAPSGCNSQEIKVYVAIKEGLFLYDENKHELNKILSDDIRENIGTQKMMHSAPLGLIYVSDYDKFSKFMYKNDETRWFFSGVDTGFVAQNVYLYCAAANLSTAFLGLVNREKLHDIMKLGDNEKIVFSQVVGKSLE